MKGKDIQRGGGFRPFLVDGHAVKATGGKTPRPSPSPLGAVEAQVQATEDWPGASAHHASTRTLEKACLERDGYRCIVTGHFSNKTPAALLPAGGGTVNTQTCHIIPLALAQYDENENSAAVCVLLAILPRLFILGCYKMLMW